MAQSGFARIWYEHKSIRLVWRVPLLFCALVPVAGQAQGKPVQERAQYASKVERWGIEEIELHSATRHKNPFLDVALMATFSHGAESLNVSGFYDGGDTWRLRFMPQTEGIWHFVVHANDAVLAGAQGSFTVTAPHAGNHGPVRVAQTFHFSYADGTPFFVLGTTMYNWINRDDTLQMQTLETLAHSPFNKVRFCIFPKWYVYNRIEPRYFPFVRRDDKSFDFDRFDVRYFQRLERRISELQNLGIQADIILFHPYDNWGFDAMDAAHDDQYLSYVAARLSSYRNVWWTMANEYDLFDPSLSKGERPPKDWNHLGTTLAAGDPYHHLIGVHDLATWYDASKPWVTHVIDQDGVHHPDLAVPLGRSAYRKPILVDEYGYEGNNGEGWGELDGRTVVKEHWELTITGGYGSHGETFVHPGGILWWSDGGTLVGDSPARLAFLKEIMTAAPFQEMEPAPDLVMGGIALTKRSEYSLFYFEHAGPVQVKLEGAGLYQADLIDPWQMKIYSMGIVSAGVHALNIHMEPCLLRFVRVPASPLAVGQNSLRERLDRFAGELASPAPSAPFHPSDPQLGTQYTLNLLLLVPPARQAIGRIAPNLNLGGINPALTLQEIFDNPNNGVTPVQADALRQALSKVKPY